MRGWVGGWMDG